MKLVELLSEKKSPKPTNPSKWSYYKSQAKKKFDVYPSAYANAWAAKQYKKAGGGWRISKEAVEGLQWHFDNEIPLRETVYRAGSTAFFEMFNLARDMYHVGELDVDWQDSELLETDLGVIVKTASGELPLDLPFEDQLDEAEYQGRNVELNKPKRGGPKKFYVYVKNPSTGKIKKVTWGDTTGLKTKTGNKGAVASFVARHKCKQKNDKTKAGYWACRTPRYKSLGVKGGQWW